MENKFGFRFVVVLYLLSFLFGLTDSIFKNDAIRKIATNLNCNEILFIEGNYSCKSSSTCPFITIRLLETEKKSSIQIIKLNSIDNNDVCEYFTDDILTEIPVYQPSSKLHICDNTTNENTKTFLINITPISSKDNYKNFYLKLDSYNSLSSYPKCEHQTKNNGIELNFNLKQINDNSEGTNLDKEIGNQTKNNKVAPKRKLFLWYFLFGDYYYQQNLQYMLFFIIIIIMIALVFCVIFPIWFNSNEMRDDSSIYTKKKKRRRDSSDSDTVVKYYSPRVNPVILQPIQYSQPTTMPIQQPLLYAVPNTYYPSNIYNNNNLNNNIYKGQQYRNHPGMY